MYFLGEQICVRMCFVTNPTDLTHLFICPAWSVTVILATPAPPKLMWCETKSHNYPPTPSLFFAIKPIIVLPPPGSVTR